MFAYIFILQSIRDQTQNNVGDENRRMNEKPEKLLSKMKRRAKYI